MKPTNLSSIVSALLIMGAVYMNSATGRAADFPQAAANAQFSAVHGFKDSTLPRLRRGVSTDAGITAALVDKLCAAPCSTQSDTGEGDSHRIKSDHWSLQVAGDGSWARFRDHEVEARAHSLEQDPAKKMSADALEKRGRSFVADKLSSAITLDAEEELVPVRTDYRFEGGQDVNTGEVTSSIVANRIVFGRTLYGVPVVGGGSTVVVTFANDGSVESFQYDWPKYEIQQYQNVLSASEILRRVQTVIGARGILPPTISLAASGSEKTAYPIALSADTTLEKLECGYYDPGAGILATGAQIQPGCVYHAVYQGQNGMRQGLAGAVPAGVQFEPDPAWPEAVALSPSSSTPTKGAERH